MRNSTIGKQLSFLKWFLRWAFKKGVHQNNAYDSYKPKLKGTQKKIIISNTLVDRQCLRQNKKRFSTALKLNFSSFYSV